jgi:hypothetical protein
MKHKGKLILKMLKELEVTWLKKWHQIRGHLMNILVADKLKHHIVVD